MHSIDDSEKAGRKAALQKLLDLMGSKTSERLAGLKKKPDMAVMEIDAEPEHGGADESDDSDDSDAGVCDHCGKPL